MFHDGKACRMTSFRYVIFFSEFRKTYVVIPDDDRRIRTQIKLIMTVLSTGEMGKAVFF
jgi:hypothetical protein